MANSTTSERKSQDFITLEKQYGGHNYDPIPVVIGRGEGVYVWDPEGNRYIDCLAAYSALNQGHRHPRLLNVLFEQAERLTLTSRAFYNDRLGLCEEFLSTSFGYDKTLMMNSGAEAVETAIKLARKWAYKVKGVHENDAEIVVAEHNFHGRTTTIVSFSSDQSARKGFGPFSRGFISIPFDDADALRKVITSNKNICAFLVEPIQGEAGVIVPKEGYLTEVAAICKEHHVLLLVDEIQTGLGRTGKMLASEYEDVRPDILMLGKALSGGIMPISAVLADDEIMLTINPGEHGSTFGGNPLASAIAIEAVKVIREEHMAENSYKHGFVFRDRLTAVKSRLIKEVRGKGLFNAVEFDEPSDSSCAREFCVRLMKNGVLAKQTHGNIIRFAPPLIITEEQLHECCDVIEKTFSEFE